MGRAFLPLARPAIKKTAPRTKKKIAIAENTDPNFGKFAERNSDILSFTFLEDLNSKSEGGPRKGDLLRYYLFSFISYQLLASWPRSINCLNNFSDGLSFTEPSGEFLPF